MLIYAQQMNIVRANIDYCYLIISRWTKGSPRGDS